MLINKPQDDEFDLVGGIKLIWNGKWKIAIIVIVFAIVGFGYEGTLPKKKFNSKSVIEPVDSIEAAKYIFYNNLIKNTKYELRDIDTTEVGDLSVSDSYPFLRVSPQLLEKLFIEIIKKRSIFEKGIDKYGLLDASKYVDKKKYEEAITKLASSIKIIEKLND